MRTQAILDRLVDELQRNCGDLLLSCKAVGVSVFFVRQWSKDEPKVAEALKEATAVGTQGLVSAAIQRAVHGVTEEIYFKGEVVGEKQVYSDGLLNTLLKAKIPEFASSEGGVQVNVNVANIMPRASNYDEWLAMKNSTLAAPATALPALTEAIDAEFSEVANPLAGLGL